MDTRILAHPMSRNGQADSYPSAPPLPRVIPGLGVKADRLLELRAALTRLQDEERALTGELTAALQELKLRAFHGRQAVAFLEARVTWRIDPELFCAMAGPKAFGAMTVHPARARRVLSPDFLEELLPDIGEQVTTPVLRVEPLAIEAA